MPTKTVSKRAEQMCKNGYPVGTCSWMAICLLIMVGVSRSDGADGNGGADGSKLMVILLDGFRWDYFNMAGVGDLPGFTRVIQNGVKAEYMIPDFPTNSYPNYYSIMTGLHVDSHGIVGNYIYDFEHGETFEMAENEETYQPHWWDDGEPLWITAENQKKRAYLYYWCQCDREIRGGHPTYCRPYDVMPTTEDIRWAISDGLKALKNASADLVGIYHEAVDKSGHRYGPNSPQVKEAILEIDREISSLLDYIEDNNLQETVNLILVSDHGMTSIDEFIDLTHVLNLDDVIEVVEAGTQVYVWPKHGREDKVFKSISSHESAHLHVYYREELKDHWIFKKHRRIPPIFVTTDPGWYIVHQKSGDIYSQQDNTVWKGNHGFDNMYEDMWAIFLAHGPNFKRGYKMAPFRNIELYNLMCDVLDIRPAPNNGTLEHVRHMLQVDNIDNSDQHVEL